MEIASRIEIYPLPATARGDWPVVLSCGRASCFLAAFPKGDAILSSSSKSMGKNVSLREYSEGDVLPLAFPFASLPNSLEHCHPLLFPLLFRVIG